MDDIGGHSGYPGSGMSPATGGYQQPHQPEQQSHKPPVSEIDASADVVWDETKARDGKSYCYHAKSGETTWTRLEGPNVKVLTQQQVIRKINHLSGPDVSKLIANVPDDINVINKVFIISFLY